MNPTGRAQCGNANCLLVDHLLLRLRGCQLGLPDGERGIPAGDPRPGHCLVLCDGDRSGSSGTSSVWHPHPIRQANRSLLWRPVRSRAHGGCGPDRHLLWCEGGAAVPRECRPTSLICRGRRGSVMCPEIMANQVSIGHCLSPPH